MKKLLILFIFAIVFIGCGKSDESEVVPVVEAPELPDVSIVDVSNESDWDYWVVTKGDYFLVKGENEKAQVASYYNSTEDKSYTMIFNDDGKLNILQVEGFTFLFKHYYDNKVDIGLYEPTGEFQVFEKVELEGSVDGVFSEQNASKTAGVSKLKSSSQWQEMINDVARAAKYVGCAASLVTAAGTGPLGTALAVVSCGSLAADITLSFVEKSNPDSILTTTVEFVATYFNGIDLGVTWSACATLNYFNCIVGLLSETSEKVKSDQELINELIDENPNLYAYNRGFTFRVYPGIIPNGMDFGELEVVGNNTSRRFLTITNKTKEEITIDGFELPEGFTSEWSGGKIGPNEDKNVFLNFDPIRAGNFSGTVKVLSSYVHVDNEIEVKAIGINPLLGNWSASLYAGWSMGQTYPNGSREGCPNLVHSMVGVKSVNYNFKENLELIRTKNNIYLYNDYINWNREDCTYDYINVVDYSDISTGYWSYEFIDDSSFRQFNSFVSYEVQFEVVGTDILKFYYNGTVTHEFIKVN
jgi:hypothetical protein